MLDFLRAFCNKPGFVTNTVTNMSTGITAPTSLAQRRKNRDPIYDTEGMFISSSFHPGCQFNPEDKFGLRPEAIST
jgi:hypothetical protein